MWSYNKIMDQNDMVPSGKMPDPVDQKNEPAAPEAGKGPVTLDEMEQMLDAVSYTHLIRLHSMGFSLMDMPSISISPLSKSIMPTTALIVVVLPAPLCPMKP